MPPTGRQVRYMNERNTLALGIDIGSTTAKVVLSDGGTILFERYQRHYSQVRQKTLEPVSYTHLTLPTKRIV